MEVRLGAKVPNSGTLPARLGIAQMAARLEQTGFDSVWVNDHVVFPAEIRSRYPFSRDGKVTWRTDTPWYDAVVALSMMAAATTRVELGAAVVVLVLRHPIIFAKQMASIDDLSGGRLTLGVGAGWLVEEFRALGIPFETRGSRLDESIGLLRSCWTGTAAAHEGSYYQLPDGLLCYPVPAHDLPIIIGGMTPAAFRRAGRIGQGWMGIQSAGAVDVEVIRGAIAMMRQAAADAGRREAAGLRAILRLLASAKAPEQVAAILPRLVAVGVTEVIVDIDWEQTDGAWRSFKILREAANGLSA